LTVGKLSGRELQPSQYVVLLQERIKLFLMQCTEDDAAKLSKLIDVYTLNSNYSSGVSTLPVDIVHGRHLE